MRVIQCDKCKKICDGKAYMVNVEEIYNSGNFNQEGMAELCEDCYEKNIKEILKCP